MRPPPRATRANKPSKQHVTFNLPKLPRDEAPEPMPKFSKKLKINPSKPKAPPPCLSRVSSDETIAESASSRTISAPNSPSTSGPCEGWDEQDDEALQAALILVRMKNSKMVGGMEVDRIPPSLHAWRLMYDGKAREGSADGSLRAMKKVNQIGEL